MNRDFVPPLLATEYTDPCAAPVRRGRRATPSPRGRAAVSETAGVLRGAQYSPVGGCVCEVGSSHIRLNKSRHSD